MKQGKKILHGISIDYSRDSLWDEVGIRKLFDGYVMEGEKSPQERLAYVSAKFASNPEHAQRLYDYSSKMWFMYSTPILAFGRNKGGLPISCFLSYVDDTKEGLVKAWAETAHLSMMGGGVGLHFRMRSVDDKSTGVMAHAKTYDASQQAFKQGKTRRGSYAIFLDIDHPEIVNFINMRKPTGDENLKAKNLNHGVNITNKFMQIIENCMKDENFDDSWDLIDPNTKKVVETVSAKWLWQELIRIRFENGEPYICFIDRINEFLPKHLKDRGLKVHGSNLCVEIMLPTNKDRTAICCLSSVNLSYYDEWKDNELFISDVIEMLDNVLQYFIDNAPNSIERAIYSATRERSIGLGTMGFHDYLQQKGVPIESAMAKSINTKIFKSLKDKTHAANLKLGAERGEAPDAVGTGMRFSHTTAIAPNASSSFMCGNTSPSIEPYASNGFKSSTSSGIFFVKNKNLDKLIKEKCKNDKSLDYDEIWSSINAEGGSIQHLDIFDDYQKSIFKTARELDQSWLVQHAADRQPYIDQGQSLNLFYKYDASFKYLHYTHFMAWKLGLKTLYYCRAEKQTQAGKVGRGVDFKSIEDKLDMKNLTSEDVGCIACEG